MLVQDPTMQLRTHASFQRAYEGVGGVELISAAPFVPCVEEGDGGASPSLLGSVGLVLLPAGVWTDERFLTLLLGEVPRLVDGPGGYGPRGSNFIPHVDVPPAILAIPTSREWSAILSVPPSPFPLLQPLKPSSTLPPREGSTFTERHAWKHCSLKPVLA